MIGKSLKFDDSLAPSLQELFASEDFDAATFLAAESQLHPLTVRQDGFAGVQSF